MHLRTDDASRNNDLLSSLTSLAPISGDDEGVDTSSGTARGDSMAAMAAELSVPFLSSKRTRYGPVADGPGVSSGVGDAESCNAPLPEILTDVDSQTLTPASQYSEPHRVPSHLQTQGCILEPSDTTDDSSAYAESLKGGRGSKLGVPFYPGEHLHCFLVQQHELTKCTSAR